MQGEMNNPQSQSMQQAYQPGFGQQQIPNVQPSQYNEPIQQGQFNQQPQYGQSNNNQFFTTEPYQPYQNQPYQNQPYQNQPYQDQPYQDQPYQDQPYQDQPYQNQPYQNQPYQNQPYQNQPYQNQPYQDQPYQDQPSQDQPSQDETDQEEQSYQQAKQGYKLPSTGVKGTKKAPKLSFIVLLVMLVAVVGSIVFYLFFYSGESTAQIRTGILHNRFKGDAVVVRDEVVFSQVDVKGIEYFAKEGEAVQRGTNICTLFSSLYNVKDLTNLEGYREKIQGRQKQLIDKSQNDPKIVELQTAIYNRALETRDMIHGEKGNMLNQEIVLQDAMQQRKTYMKQKFSDDQMLIRLYDDEHMQLQEIQGFSKQRAAASNGIVSFYSDGFEAFINIDNYSKYTPEQVRQIYNGKVPDGVKTAKEGETVYRLIKEEDWVVLMLCEDPTWTPTKGREYNLNIHGYDNTVVSAVVENFTKTNGEMLIRLRIKDVDVRSIMYVRSCQVQLTESVNSYIVPTRSIYQKDGRDGVVFVAENDAEYWTPVDVISRSGDDAYIIPEHLEHLSEGMQVILH